MTKVKLTKTKMPAELAGIFVFTKRDIQRRRLNEYKSVLNSILVACLRNIPTFVIAITYYYQPL